MGKTLERKVRSVEVERGLEDRYTISDEEENKFKGYKFRVNWYSSEPYDPEKEMIDVRITTRDGKEYTANFTTLKFLEYMFEKNRRTGELLSGTYFCMPNNIIIVRRLTEENIKATIDDLIQEEEVEKYLTQLED